MSNKKFTILAIFLSLTIMAMAMLPLTGCSGRSDEQAIISMISGEVQVMASGEHDWATAKVGATLEKGDTIKVGDDSLAVLTFFEGSTCEVEAGTTVSIADLSQASDGSAKSIVLNEEVGKTINRVSKLTDSASTYEVETPACVAVVRGSVMEVNVGTDGTTDVSNIEGTISATGQGTEVNIPVGMQSTVVPGQPPSDPVPIGGEGAGVIKIKKSILSIEDNKITYLYEVSNVGNTPQTNVYVEDENVDDITYDSGDTNGNEVLDPGETWLFIGVVES